MSPKEGFDEADSSDGDAKICAQLSEIHKFVAAAYASGSGDFGPTYFI